MRDEAAYLWDMLDSAYAILKYIHGKTFEAFVTDPILQDAVIRRFSIIGEAAARISDQTRAQLSDLPFREMARMRNIVMHAYWSVDLRIVWDTAQSDLPQLINRLQPLLPPQT